MVKGFENIIVLDKLSFSNYITADIRKNSMTEHKKYPLKKLLLSCGIILFLAGFCGVEAYMHLARSYDYHVVTRCIANLKLNGHLCYMYAEENNGKFRREKSPPNRRTFFTYLTTMLIIFPGTTISLTIVFPSMARATFSSALTVARTVSLSAPFAIITTERTLPFT